MDLKENERKALSLIVENRTAPDMFTFKIEREEKAPRALPGREFLKKIFIQSGERERETFETHKCRYRTTNASHGNHLTEIESPVIFYSLQVPVKHLSRGFNLKGRSGIRNSLVLKNLGEGKAK